jgi:hypothetical protein
MENSNRQYVQLWLDGRITRRELAEALGVSYTGTYIYTSIILKEMYEENERLTLMQKIKKHIYEQSNRT